MKNIFAMKLFAIKPVFLVWGIATIFIIILLSDWKMGFLPFFFLNRIFPIIIACVFFLSFACFGHYITGLFLKTQDFPLRWLSGIAIGMGVYSVYVFLVGTFLSLDKNLLVLPIFIMFFIGWKNLKILISHIQGFIKVREDILKSFTLFEHFLLLCIFFSVALTITTAFIPELSYDSLSYHLAVPRIWLRHNRIFPLPDNVYAFFPFGMHMLYTVGLALGEMALVRLFNIFTGIILLFAIYSMGKRWAGRTAGLIGSAIFYVSAEVFLNSVQVFVDLGVALYTFLVVSILVDSISNNSLNFGKIIIAGLISGFACSIKYPAVLFVAVLAGGLIFFYKTSFLKRLYMFLVFQAVTLIIFCPWLVRNMLATGNPVFPLLYNIFGGTIWEQQLALRFNLAHDAGEFGLHMFTAVIKRLLGIDTGNSLYFLLLPLGIFWAFVYKRTRILVFWIIAFWMCWALLTHRIERFFLPVLPSIALLLGCSLGNMGGIKKDFLLPKMLFEKVRRLSMCFIVVVAGINLISISSFWAAIEPLGILFGKQTASDYLTQMLPAYPMYQAINKLPPESKVLFIGDAQTFYIERDVLSSSAFNRNIIERIVAESNNPKQVMEKIKNYGITHIYINFPEIDRLARGYGFLKDFNWGLFQSFVEDLLEPVFVVGEGRLVLYRVK